jgi:hypothetical protein
MMYGYLHNNNKSHISEPIKKEIDSIIESEVKPSRNKGNRMMRKIKVCVRKSMKNILTFLL